MFIQITTFLCAIQMLANECKCLRFIDLPSDSEDLASKIEKDPFEKASLAVERVIPYPPIKTPEPIRRRFMPKPLKQKLDRMDRTGGKVSNDQDDYLKQKISMLIDQTLHDVKKKLHSVDQLKDHVREDPQYKAGFVLSMIRKTRVMLNDLFNLAVKHRNNWKALQQLKVFEYIVHTNVDTNNLVRQLVEVYIQHVNATSSQSDKKRVVLL